MDVTEVAVQPWLWVRRQHTIQFLEVHATRGGGDPFSQFAATVGWMQSPNNRAKDEDGNLLDFGGSCSYIIGRRGELAKVLDDDQQPTYCAGYGATLRPTGYAIDELGIAYEWCQTTALEEYSTEQYERGATEFARKSQMYSIPPMFLTPSVQSPPPPQTMRGAVRHDRCENGAKLGKSDPGAKFREVDFVELWRQKMKDTEPIPEITAEELTTMIQPIRIIGQSGTQYMWTPDTIRPIAAIEAEILDEARDEHGWKYLERIINPLQERAMMENYRQNK
jgi:hypothetical protein